MREITPEEIDSTLQMGSRNRIGRERYSQKVSAFAGHAKT